jgi:cytochrome c oxidase assembly factor CtaG
MWHTQPERRPHSRRGIIWHVVLPLVLHLALALLFLVGLPQLLFHSSLSFFLLWVPDFGYTLLVSGVVALGWGILHTVLAVLVLRKRSALQVIGTPIKA